MQKINKIAVMRLGGKQYKVHEGLEVLIDKLADTKEKADALLVADGTKVKIGKPVLKDVEIKYSVVKDLEKGDKVKGFKYKSKSRYRKRFGFRHSYTRIKVEKIS